MANGSQYDTLNRISVLHNWSGEWTFFIKGTDTGYKAQVLDSGTWQTFEEIDTVDVLERCESYLGSGGAWQGFEDTDLIKVLEWCESYLDDDSFHSAHDERKRKDKGKRIVGLVWTDR